MLLLLLCSIRVSRSASLLTCFLTVLRLTHQLGQLPLWRLQPSRQLCTLLRLSIGTGNNRFRVYNIDRVYRGVEDTDVPLHAQAWLVEIAPHRSKLCEQRDVVLFYQASRSAASGSNLKPQALAGAAFGRAGQVLWTVPAVVAALWWHLLSAHATFTRAFALAKSTARGLDAMAAVGGERSWVVP